LTCSGLATTRWFSFAYLGKGRGTHERPPQSSRERVLDLAYSSFKNMSVFCISRLRARWARSCLFPISVCLMCARDIFEAPFLHIPTYPHPPHPTPPHPPTYTQATYLSTPARTQKKRSNVEEHQVRRASGHLSKSS
jgi:hypothetical protein